jgi:hypothetical protein
MTSSLRFLRLAFWAAALLALTLATRLPSQAQQILGEFVSTETEILGC